MGSPWASIRSVTTTHHSSCWRAGRRCSPGPTLSANASPPAGAAWCATTCRDSGESTTADPEAPAYSLRDLAADAAALTDVLGGGPAHLAGIGVGGMVAQVAALDHPGAFSALTLASTHAVAPGPPDDDLPDHDQATMSRLFAHPMPDWTDRDTVAEFAAAGAEILGDDPVAAHAIAARIWDRTPGTAPPVQMANQMGMVFSKLDCKPRWRERLPKIEIPTLVVHGRRDPFFPVGNGEAIAARSPGRGCSSSRRPPLRSPMRRPARSPRRCSRSGRGRRSAAWVCSSGRLQLQLELGRTDHASHNSRPLRRFRVPLNAGSETVPGSAVADQERPDRTDRQFCALTPESCGGPPIVVCASWGRRWWLGHDGDVDRASNGTVSYPCATRSVGQ